MAGDEVGRQRLMVGDVAHVAPDLLGQQVLIVGLHSRQRIGQRPDRPAQFHDLPLEQIDGFDVGSAPRRERLLLDGVDVGLHRFGHRSVRVDDVVGDRVHHRGRTQFETFGILLELPANHREPGVVSMPNRDGEVGPDEHHDLAGLDDLTGQRHRFVRHVLHRLEDQEQDVVIAFDFGPLVGVHRVLHRQRMKAVDLSDRLHLFGVRFVQPDPHEGPQTTLFKFAHLGQRSLVGVGTGQTLAVAVHGTVDHGLRHRCWLRFVFRIMDQVHFEQYRRASLKLRHGNDLPAAGRAPGLGSSVMLRAHPHWLSEIRDPATGWARSPSPGTGPEIPGRTGCARFLGAAFPVPSFPSSEPGPQQGAFPCAQRPSKSPSPAPPVRSATACCSGWRAEPCSAPTVRSNCVYSRSNPPSRHSRVWSWNSMTARSGRWPAWRSVPTRPRSLMA